MSHKYSFLVTPLERLNRKRQHKRFMSYFQKIIKDLISRYLNRLAAHFR